VSVLDENTRKLLREARAHGDSRFPLGVYEMAFSPRTMVIDCHWHEEAEFFYIADGEVLFQVDTETFVLRAGEAAYIDGGDIHAAYSSGDAACSFQAVVFDVRLLDGLHYDAVQESAVAPLRDRTRTFPRHIRPDSKWEKELLKSIRTVIDCYNSAVPGYETAIKGHLFLMLHQLAVSGRSANRSLSAGGGTRTDRLKRTLLYMQQHYSRTIQVRELAEQIPMSESQFCRFFKSMTRQTPVEYLNAYRVKRAAELLRATDRKISDIAMEVGFGHISYFIKVFQKIMKATPSQYRTVKDGMAGLPEGQAQEPDPSDRT
jgi:AraC-like DNA-binding protein/quercetin dioxygenase-like cupin family protein